MKKTKLVAFILGTAVTALVVLGIVTTALEFGNTSKPTMSNGMAANGMNDSVTGTMSGTMTESMAGSMTGNGMMGTGTMSDARPAQANMMSVTPKKM